eukprot:SAG11_NODE_8010_length_1070_cov_2.726056_2_plen_222_part_01
MAEKAAEVTGCTRWGLRCVNFCRTTRWSRLVRSSGQHRGGRGHPLTYHSAIISTANLRGLKDQCVCGELFASVWGLRVHSRTCPAAQENFEKDDDGDEFQDVEALLAVRGPPERRFWRVKWAGKDSEGNDRWPDEGDGNGLAAFGWQSEANLSVGCVDLQNKFWRDHRDLDRTAANPVPGEPRCDRCNQIFATGAAMARHQAKPTKKNKAFVCPKRERLPS